MKARSILFKIAVVVALLLSASLLWGQDGFEGALSRTIFQSQPHLGTGFRQVLAGADFDGDHKPDGAFLVDDDFQLSASTFRTIELHFTGHPNSDLKFQSIETNLSVSAYDVNRDGAADIIVEQPITHKRLQVWLNDGTGGFRKVAGEDFPAPRAPDRLGFESPTSRHDFSAAGLLSADGSDLAVLIARSLSSDSFVVGEPLPGFRSSAGSTSASSSSSRAPPVCQSL